MSVSHIVLITLAGLGAGAINALVGSGTLITFPTIVALGYPPVTSTMSNAIGLVPPPRISPPRTVPFTLLLSPAASAASTARPDPAYLNYNPASCL